MRYASELRKFSHFHILKLLFPSIFCWYFRYFVSETYLISGVNILHTYTINAVSFYYSWYGAIYKRQYTDKTLTLRKCMCMRASGACELRKFWYFYILKLLFLSIFCRYIRYIVGTNVMLVGLHVPTNFQMYRQMSEKALLGGGGQLPPCPPSGYANAPCFALVICTAHLLRPLYFKILDPPLN